MAKIEDRLLLGAIAGLGGNILKLSILEIAKRLKWAEFNGTDAATGILLPAHKVAEPKGKLVGILGDATIAGVLGVTITYVLSITGKDKALFKGASSGMFMWTALYGAMGSIGLTKVKPSSPKTVLSQFIGHAAFGAVAAALATQLGDPSLFTGKIPLKASSKSQLTAKQPQQLYKPVQMSEVSVPQGQQKEKVLYH